MTCFQSAVAGRKLTWTVAAVVLRSGGTRPSRLNLLQESHEARLGKYPSSKHYLNLGHMATVSIR